MKFSRRETIALGVGAVALGVMPYRVNAAVEDLIAEFAEGATVGEGGVDLIAPEIAENGNTVPIEVDAPGAEAVMLLAAGNPSPDVCTFNFGPLAGTQAASTRIRLAGEQDVIAIARMPDGTFKQARQNVRVTIGGCGG